MNIKNSIQYYTDALWFPLADMVGKAYGNMKKENDSLIRLSSVRPQASNWAWQRLKTTQFPKYVRNPDAIILGRITHPPLHASPLEPKNPAWHGTRAEQQVTKQARNTTLLNMTRLPPSGLVRKLKLLTDQSTLSFSLKANEAVHCQFHN